MIFFMAMPFLTGLINYVMPLQIGARDVLPGDELDQPRAYRRRRRRSSWSRWSSANSRPAAGADIRPIPSCIQSRRRARLLDLGALAVVRSASTMTGINFAVTIYKRRAPGMS